MESLLAHCTALFSANGGLLLAFFLGGLTGSVTHCLAMCGPLVACQAACGGSCSKRISQTTQWQYHAGRLITYSALGFAVALLSRHLAAYAFWPQLASAMLMMAGALFLFSSIYGGRHPAFLSARVGFTRGLLMGFMPCGLIYAALMVAATLTNPWQAMAAMAMFVLGTMPVLLLASSGAALLAQRWQQTMTHAGRAWMAFNGLSLMVIATGQMR